MASEINISVLIRLAAEQARREAAAFGGDVKALGAAAEEAGRKTAAAGAAIDQAGAAAQGAASGTTAVNTALSLAISQAGGITAQMGQAATSIAGVQGAVSGLTMAMGAEVEAMLREQQAAAAWQAELDGLRARFVPLFAASQQYEAQVRQIAEAEQLGAISALEAATARYRAEQSYQALTAAITATIQPVTQMTGAMTAAETVMQRQAAAFAGIKSAADSAFSSQLRHGAMLDDLKAKFNPLFAASRDYELQLHGIAEAERLGALSSQEAAAARTRAAQALAPMNAGLRQFGDNSRAAGAHAANLSFQMNDIFMMTAVGQSPWMLMMQQGPQVIQIMGQMRSQGLSMGTALRGSLAMVLNPVGLLTMGMIGLGAAGVQALTKLGGKTKTFDDEMKDLNTTLGRMRSNLELLGTLRLEDTFGSLTNSVRGLAKGMLDLDRASELKQLGEVIDGFLDKEVKVPWYSWDSLAMGMAMGVAPIPGVTTDDYVNNTPGRSDRYTALGAANSFDDFEKRTADIKTLADAGDIDGVTQALMDLQAAMSGGGTVTGMKDELRELLAELTKTGLETARIEALWNGSAQNSAITNHINQMVLGYTQQVELAETSLRFGENSVEVEEARARHAREVLRIRLEDMKVQQGSADEIRAYAALEARINADADAAQARRKKAQDEVFADLGRQQELSTAILQFGETSAEVEAVRARHAWDVQAARLAEMGLGPQLIAQAQALFQAERDRANAIRDAAAAKQGTDLLTELREEAAISQAILIHGEDSLRVKELQIAAERRAFELQLATMQVSEQTKEHLREAWEAARGLASADPFGRIAAGNTYFKGQQERIDKLRVEQALLGQSETIQRRTIALWQVERDLRREGIDLTSARAAEIRAAALQEFELTRNIERQSAAWQRVQSSAESAIDGIVKKLMGGDIGGALDALATEITGMFTDLAVTNPLKNALLGTNYGTMQDVGGLQGIWGRLTGQAPALTPTASSMGVGSMTVTAATVILNGSLSAALAGGAANLAGAPSMSGDVQKQIWEFFTGKGLQPHQIAGIMGNVQGESAFNPGAVGDNGTSFGLFQHHAGRGAGLLNAVGGMGGLGDVQGQLEYVWQELMTTERAALEKLLASKDVAGATSAWMTGFERPSEQAMTESWSARMAAAEAAMGTFAATTTDATGGLGTLGEGFGAFGQALTGALTGALSAGGGGGGFWGALANFAGSAMGIPGFAAGGPTGGSNPAKVAGVVHEREYVFDASSTARIGVENLEALRRGSLPGFARGGYVSALPMPVPSRSPAFYQRSSGDGSQGMPQIIFNDHSRGVDMEVEETVAPGGGRALSFTLSERVGQAMAQPGGAAKRALKTMGVQSPRALR